MKEIWIPKSETFVTIVNGNIRIGEEMVMTLKKIDSGKPGFVKT